MKPLHLPAAVHRRRPSPGFSMVEILLGSVIVGIALGALMSVFNRQVTFTTRTAALDAIDAAVATDLTWIKSYAKFYELAAGPYNLTYAQTGGDPTGYGLTSASAIQTSSYLDYTPSDDECDAGTLPQSFITMAASNAVTPLGGVDRPNPIPTTSGDPQTIALPAVASAYTLTRRINFTGLTNRIRVVYSLSGGDAAQLPYPREASILLETSAWCYS